jgi:hypothetical protein
MLFPEQVIPFLEHNDPIVRERALRYFRDSYDLGPLTADHFWAIIDRLGENESTLEYAVRLDAIPQTDWSLHRLVRAFGGKPAEIFEFHYQHAAAAMDLTVLARNRDELLSCPHLLPHVRERLELRLNLLDSGPATAWNRLMEHGRELGGAYAESFNTGLSDALIEAAARGGPPVCEQALLALADKSAADDWREIFAARVLGLARYEPAVSALVGKLAIDDDVLRDEVNRSLSRIGSVNVIDRVVAFYPGKAWHVRLFASGSLGNIKRPEAVSALMQLVALELALGELAAGPGSNRGDSDSLIDELLHDLTRLGSLAGLSESRRLVAAYPEHPEAIDLCESLLATAIMTGVTLPEESAWRSRLKPRGVRTTAGSDDLEAMSRDIRDHWRKTGIPFREGPRSQEAPAAAIAARPIAPLLQTHADRLGPIRNTASKIGRNEPCPCGSQKKYKKCCGK